MSSGAASAGPLQLVQMRFEPQIDPASIARSDNLSLSPDFS
jgi:hypothetical protein